MRTLVGSNLRIYLNFESSVPEDDEHEWRRLAIPPDASFCEEGDRCSSGQARFALCHFHCWNFLTVDECRD